MAMPLRPLIIVTDAKGFGDDGAAISMLQAAGADIRLIVATNGNVWAEEAAHNVRALLKRSGRDDIEVCVDSLSVVDERRARTPPEDRQAAHYIGALGDSPAAAALYEAPSCADLLHAIDAMNQPDLLVIGPATALAPLTAAHAD